MRSTTELQGQLKIIYLQVPLEIVPDDELEETGLLPAPYFTVQYVGGLTGVGSGSAAPHPHPPHCNSGLYFPFEAPGPDNPVTEKADILISSYYNPFFIQPFLKLYFKVLFRFKIFKCNFTNRTTFSSYIYC